MPELAIANVEGELLPFAPAIVLGCMYFPERRRLAATFTASICCDEILDALADPRGSGMREAAQGLTAEPTFWRLPRLAARLDELFRMAAARHWKGVTAARILIEALAAGLERDGVHGSISAIVGEMIKPRRGRSVLLEAWSAFRPAAPLWAAAMVLYARMNAREPSRWDAVVGAISDDLPGFLVIAESFRLEAQRQRTPYRRGTLLEPGEAFTFPAVSPGPS